MSCERFGEVGNAFRFLASSETCSEVKSNLMSFNILEYYLSAVNSFPIFR
jgi:hypothetical protein